MQAQEFPFAKWGLALRLRRQVTDVEVERAFADGEILRTHVLRPTWHFVAANDIVWMQELTAPRVHVAMRSYRVRLGLDDAVMRRAMTVFERALAGGMSLTRAELAGRLSRAGITVSHTPLAMIVMYAELERVICSGPRRGKAFTYALVSERAPGARPLPAEEALGTLARRFFASHGPATVKDFVWWSGLLTADARRAVEIAGLRSSDVDGLTYWSTDATPSRRGASGVHLLPIYDEYLVAYRDRLAVPHSTGAAPSTVTFRHALIVNGQVAGTWVVTKTRAALELVVTPARRLSRVEVRGVEAAAGRYGVFSGAEVRLGIRYSG